MYSLTPSARFPKSAGNVGLSPPPGRTIAVIPKLMEGVISYNGKARDSMVEVS